MSTLHLRTAAVLLVGLAMAADPALAQRERQDRSEGRRDGGGRSENRGRRAEGGAQAREARPRREPQVRPNDRARQERRADASRPNGGARAQVQQNAGARAPVQQGGAGARVQRWPDNVRRDNDRRAVQRDDRSRVDGFRNGGRTVVVRPRVVVPSYRAYGGRPFQRRAYVVPFGYRPYGFRRGWNANLYFGRPFGGTHIYAGRPYGYYSLAPGFAFGALRIVDAPRYARVFVDGYYAGEVDDYDGVFQRLNLEAGPHQIEIEVEPGFEPLVFDVRIVPGQTVTIHADGRY